MKKLSPNGKKLIFAVLFLSCLLAFLAILTTPTLAQTLTSPGTTLNSLSGPTGVAKIIGRFISVFVLTAGAFALLMFFYGGIIWITSMGNTANIQKGKGILVWATLGLIVIIFARVITDFLIFALTYNIQPPLPVVPTPPPVVIPTPPPPPAEDKCGKTTLVGGVCIQKTVAETSCDKFTPPKEQLAEGADNCEGTAGGAAAAANYLCCKPYPADTCTACLAGDIAKAADVCAAQSSPQVPDTTKTCTTSAKLTPPKPICCKPPTGDCPWAERPMLGDTMNTPYDSCTNGPGLKNGKSCCDCGKPNSGTSPDWQCKMVGNFMNKTPSNTFGTQVLYPGYTWIAFTAYPSLSKVNHCGIASNTLCAKQCVHGAVAVIMQEYENCFLKPNIPNTYDAANDCRTQALEKAKATVNCN